MTGGAAPARPIRILALGDSYTIGESVREDDRWPVQLAARLETLGVSAAAPVIVARTGWTTDELSAGIDAAKPDGPFDVVTLLIGVNDQYRGRPAAQFREQLATLVVRAIDLAGGVASRVVVVSIPDWGVTPFATGRDRARIAMEIDAFNAILRQEAARMRARVVDVTPISRSAAADPSLTAADGLHPSGTMYSRWCDAIAPAALAAIRDR